MEIYLIRHVPVDAEGLCYGQVDVPLADGYEDALEALKQKMGDMDRYTIYSSDAERCRLTAQALAAGPVIEDVRLREMAFGDWENVEWEAIPKDALQHWSHDLLNIAPPGGETCGQMLARVRELWQEMLAGGKPCVLVTHTGWIRLLLGDLLGMPVANAFSLNIDYCGVSRVVYHQGHFSIRYINR